MKNISVIGLGTMGHGIAQTFALAGYDVRGFDELAPARESALDRIRTSLTAAAEAELVEPSVIEPTLSRITVCETLPDALRDAQFVTEAVREDLSVKQELFPQMEEHVAAETILASNTSSFPMTESTPEASRVPDTRTMPPAPAGSPASSTGAGSRTRPPGTQRSRAA